MNELFDREESARKIRQAKEKRILDDGARLIDVQCAAENNRPSVIPRIRTMGDDSLLQQIQKRQFLAEQLVTVHRQLITVHRQLIEVDADIFSRFGRLVSTLQPYPTEQRSRGKTVIVPAVESILRACGYPLRTQEILSALAARNIHVGGKRPIGNLSAILSMSGVLGNTEGTWWPKGVERPEKTKATHTG